MISEETLKDVWEYSPILDGDDDDRGDADDWNDYYARAIADYNSHDFLKD